MGLLLEGEELCWLLPGARSSSMVSYLKLLREFLMLRRRFVSATL